MAVASAATSTPTLSQRDREEVRPAIDETRAFLIGRNDLSCSLSLWERVGVRGILYSRTNHSGRADAHAWANPSAVSQK